MSLFPCHRRPLTHSLTHIVYFYSVYCVFVQWAVCPHFVCLLMCVSLQCYCQLDNPAIHFCGQQCSTIMSPATPFSFLLSSRALKADQPNCALCLFSSCLMCINGCCISCSRWVYLIIYASFLSSLLKSSPPLLGFALTVWKLIKCFISLEVK